MLDSIVGYTLATRYADALINIAQRENSIDRMYDEFRELRAAFYADDRKLSKLFKAVGVKTDEKKIILDKLFEYIKCSKYVQNLFYLMLEIDREQLVDYIFVSFSHKYHILRNMLNVYVESAIELQESDKKRITDYLKKITGKTIILNHTVNPEIIGGMIIKYGDKTLNGSVIRNFELMSKTFLN